MKALKILGVVTVALVCLLGIGFLAMAKQQNDALAKLSNVPIDMQTVADGTYSGESEAAMVAAEVAVTVKDHTIAAVKLVRHQTGLGKAAEAILPKMVDQNTDAVDAVSGATASSLVLRNAANQALRKGITP